MKTEMEAGGKCTRNNEYFKLGSSGENSDENNNFDADIGAQDVTKVCESASKLLEIDEIFVAL